MKVSFKDNILSFDKGNIEKSEESFKKLRLIGALCNNASPKNDDDKKEFLGDPIEIALVYLTHQILSVQEIKLQYERIGEYTF